MTDLKECDLYEPIKAFFIEHGYLVRGEVKNIDMVISKDDDVMAIELKPSFNLKLILQAVDRQKMFDSVYVAIFKPKSINKRYKEIVHLTKRLEIGLITVNILKSGTRVTIEHHPLEYNRKKNHRRKRAVISEITRRTGLVDNQGGTTRMKRMTAYREECLAVATALEILGPSSPKAVKEIVQISKSGQIMYQNHYGWFDRIGQGLYRITNKGQEALITYQEVSNHFREIVKERTINENQ